MRSPARVGIAGIVVVVAVSLASCSVVPSTPVQTTFIPPTPDVSSPVEGVVIEVEAVGLTDVRGFTLRTSGGFAFEFTLGPLENPTEFPPSHLSEHRATSSPVRVYFRIENGNRVAYRLEDAGPSPAPSSAAS